MSKPTPEKEKREMEFANEMLLFIEPACHPGVNTTMRLGRKWVEAAPPGCFVEIGTTPTIPGNRPLSHGRHLVIGSAWFERVDDIPCSLLAFQHDQTCRDRAGLMRALVRAYGEDFELAERGVTVLIFYFNPSAAIRKEPDDE